METTSQDTGKHPCKNCGNLLFPGLVCEKCGDSQEISDPKIEIEPWNPEGNELIEYFMKKFQEVSCIPKTYFEEKKFQDFRK
jgi:DNA-directed RNA polymerase subunit M/transcription elongation factor TFIIS